MTNAQKYKIAKGKLAAAKTEAAKKSARASMKKFAPTKKKPAAKKPTAKKKTKTVTGGRVAAASPRNAVGSTPKKKKARKRKIAAKRKAVAARRRASAAGLSPAQPHERIPVHGGHSPTAAKKPRKKKKTEAQRRAADRTHLAGRTSATNRQKAAKKGAATRKRNLKLKAEKRAAAARRRAATARKTAKGKTAKRKTRKTAITHTRKAKKTVTRARKTSKTVKRRAKSRAKLPKLHKSKRRVVVTAKKRASRKGATPRQIAKRAGAGLSRSQKRKVAQTFRSKRQQIKVHDYHTQVWMDRKNHKLTSMSVNRHYAPNPVGEGVMGVVKLTATLAIALVAMDIIDRQIATMKPGGGSYYGKDAEIRLLAKPSVVRVAVPAAVGVGALVGSAYLMEKYPTWAYVTAGVGIAGLVYAGSKAITYFLMPAALSAPNGDELNMGNAWFPMEQDAPQARIAKAIEAQDKAVEKTPWYPFADKAAADAAKTLPASFKGELPLPTTQSPPKEGFPGLAGPRQIPRQNALAGIPRFTQVAAPKKFVEPVASGRLGQPATALPANRPAQPAMFSPVSAPPQTGLGCGGGCGGPMPPLGGSCKACSAKKAASDLGLTVPEGYRAVRSLAADGTPVITFAPLAGAPEAPRAQAPAPARAPAPVASAPPSSNFLSRVKTPKEKKRQLFTN